MRSTGNSNEVSAKYDKISIMPEFVSPAIMRQQPEYSGVAARAQISQTVREQYAHEPMSRLYTALILGIHGLKLARTRLDQGHIDWDAFAVLKNHYTGTLDGLWDLAFEKQSQPPWPYFIEWMELRAAVWMEYPYKTLENNWLSKLKNKAVEAMTANHIGLRALSQHLISSQKNPSTEKTIAQLCDTLTAAGYATQVKGLRTLSNNGYAHDYTWLKAYETQLRPIHDAPSLSSTTVQTSQRIENDHEIEALLGLDAPLSFLPPAAPAPQKKGGLQRASSAEPFEDMPDEPPPPLDEYDDHDDYTM